MAHVAATQLVSDPRSSVGVPDLKNCVLQGSAYYRGVQGYQLHIMLMYNHTHTASHIYLS